MKPEVLLRDVEPDDLPVFFEHQRDPVAVATVVFRSRDKAEFDEPRKKLRSRGEPVCFWEEFYLPWHVGADTSLYVPWNRCVPSTPEWPGTTLRPCASCFTLCKSAIDQEPELVGESHILLTLAAPHSNRAKTS